LAVSENELTSSRNALSVFSFSRRVLPVFTELRSVAAMSGNTSA
jgi:hypothetical protein